MTGSLPVTAASIYACHQTSSPQCRARSPTQHWSTSSADPPRPGSTIEDDSSSLTRAKLPETPTTDTTCTPRAQSPASSWPASGLPQCPNSERAPRRQPLVLTTEDPACSSSSIGVAKNPVVRLPPLTREGKGQLHARACSGRRTSHIS